MKKFASLLMAALMLAAMLTVFAVPASAEIFQGNVEIPSGFYSEGIEIWPLANAKVNSDVSFSSHLIIHDFSSIVIGSNGFLTTQNPIRLGMLPNGQPIKIEDGGGLSLTFQDSDDANSFVRSLIDNGIAFNRNGNTIQAGTCRHDGGEHTVCRQCGQPVSGGKGSTLGDGSLTIICTVAGVALGFVAAMFIFKKKKKPALASGADNTEEK